MNLDALYQQTILEYSSRKDLNHEMDSPDFVERGHNANCGDDITLLVKINEQNIVEDLSFIGSGCAISTASTAMLIDLVKGSNVENAQEKINIFFRMMRDEDPSEDELDLIGDASLLHSTSKLPARVKCATLSWHTLQVIFKKHNEE
ncbi:MAG: SUF system NifU family Fe-S cluster assembly protein [Peptostreptococcaceae bacterium]|nr:SUF system NifU family Fe-S cluster assembly protein [Peptostreptococcaceae bacterium]